jgi:hypothetical protein
MAQIVASQPQDASFHEPFPGGLSGEGYHHAQVVLCFFIPTEQNPCQAAASTEDFLAGSIYHAWVVACRRVKQSFFQCAF